MIAAESDVRGAFLAALILTGSPDAAEAAVLDAIATSGCEMDELFVATAKCAIQRSGECLPQPQILSSLPIELQRLFLLAPTGRKCFVLRILMGLTLQITSEILNLRTDEVDESLCLAVSQLPSLVGIQNPYKAKGSTAPSHPATAIR